MFDLLHAASTDPATRESNGKRARPGQGFGMSRPCGLQMVVSPWQSVHQDAVFHSGCRMRPASHHIKFERLKGPAELQLVDALAHLFRQHRSRFPLQIRAEVEIQSPLEVGDGLVLPSKPGSGQNPYQARFLIPWARGNCQVSLMAAYSYLPFRTWARPGFWKALASCRLMAVALS